MITNHEAFIEAIRSKNRLQIRFRSKEDGAAILERICAPMDYGPGRKIRDGLSRYWVWDYTSDSKAHVLGLPDTQIVGLTVLDDTFDPGGFVTWTPDWIVSRDWGAYS